MVSVKLEHVTKYFGQTRALYDINFEVKDGEFMTLLGPSGCGKTTTLRIIAGLEKQTKGNIYFDDQIVNDLSPRDRNVAMVFQNYALYPHMTVYDNIAFPLKNMKISKNEIDKRVKNVADMLQIKDLLNRKPGELSGGQQQRVALGRAIVRNPSIFLLDEPLSNLDAKLRVYMRAELKRIQKELKITTIYVTHDQIEATSMSDRIVILMSGVIQQVGTPEEIYNFPSNINVAGFIGNPPMNFLQGTFDENKKVIDFGTFMYHLEKEIYDILLKKINSNEIILGIRPEHMYIAENKDTNTLETKIYFLENMGDIAILNVYYEDTLIKIKVPSNFKAKTGEKVYIKFKEKHIHIFDKKTGKIIL